MCVNFFCQTTYHHTRPSITSICNIRPRHNKLHTTYHQHSRFHTYINIYYFNRKHHLPPIQLVQESRLDTIQRRKWSCFLKLPRTQILQITLSNIILQAEKHHIPKGITCRLLLEDTRQKIKHRDSMHTKKHHNSVRN